MGKVKLNHGPLTIMEAIFTATEETQEILTFSLKIRLLIVKI